jgi:hypothetical protein
MSDDKPLAIVVREIVSVMRRGGGILGKSAGLIALLVVCVGIALVRVPPSEILNVLLVGAAVVFVWFFPILWLVNKFPDKAMLEGPEWAQHQEKIWLASKEHSVISANSQSELINSPTRTALPNDPSGKSEGKL